MSTNSDVPILASVDIDNASQRPLRRDEIVFVEYYNISHLEIARRMVPFHESMDNIHVFSGPSLPEVANQTLTEIPAL